MRLIVKLVIIFLCLTILSPEPVKYNWEYMKEFEVIKSQYKKLTYNIFESATDASRIYRLNRNVLLAIIYSESRFNPNAISSAGAVGLMQVMPFWVKPSETSFLYCSRSNILIGSKIFKVYLDQAKGNTILALKFYNSGPNGKIFNGPYIVEIMNNVASSNPDETIGTLMGRL